jgi:hypothetical protein
MLVAARIVSERRLHRGKPERHCKSARQNNGRLGHIKLATAVQSIQ